MLSDFQVKLIRLLSDGEFHSGSEVGEVLGVSRAAIWKQVQKLEELGLEVFSLKGKGYRLAMPLDLFSHDKISACLQHSNHLLSELVIEQQISSTNDVVLEKAKVGIGKGSIGKGYVVLAESQLAGRGRGGRQWVSPFASNLYMSLHWRFAGGAAALEGLSLVVGLAIAEALETLGLRSVGLKWPNDVLVDNKKICGVLIEVVGDATGPCSAVIGVGVNIDMPAAAGEAIDQEWTDVNQALAGQSRPDRNKITGVLLDSILSASDQFEKFGLLQFVERWKQYDLCEGKPVNLVIGNETIAGVGEGIDASGGIRVRLADGQSKIFKGGEISLRVQPA